MTPHRKWSLSELAYALRFAIVGGVATLVHLALVWTLINMGVHALLSNLLAFLTAFWVSLCGHYYWSFRSNGGFSAALLAFGLIACCGFLMNTVVLAALLRTGWLSAKVSATISTLVVPVITYLASRFWGFKPKN